MDRSRVTVSICVLSFNGREVLERCLHSIYNLDLGSSIESMEVFVTDNGSKDGTAVLVKSKFPQVKLIVNQQNEYFTKPYNRMLKEASGRYILIISNDVELPEASLGVLVEFMERHSDAGIAVPMSCGSDGRREPVCKREATLWGLILQWTVLGWFFEQQRGRWSADSQYDLGMIQAVDVAQDSCLIVRRDLIDRVGLYDESFKLYYTEDDLCKQARLHGWKVVYYPAVKVKHLRNYTTNKLNPLSVKWIYLTDMFRYSRKYIGLWQTVLILQPLAYLTLVLQVPRWFWRRTLRGSRIASHGVTESYRN